MSADQEVRESATTVGAEAGDDREQSSPILCPSAQPDMEGAVAFGVVDHTLPVPEVAYLEKLLPVNPELLEMARPLRPTEIFRFTAPCQMEACSHWGGEECKLAGRVVRMIPAVSESLPRCHIRSRCRWYTQAGRVACGRCPTIVTQNEAPSDTMREAATPE